MGGQGQLARKGLISAIIVIGLLMAMTIAYYLRNQNYSVDDSFITYRYAFHLSQGDGLTFNVGEKYYGTTAAGYAIVLATFDKLSSILNLNLSTQNISVGISTLALLITSLFAFSVARRRGSPTASSLLTLGLAVSLFTAYSFNEVAGHETYAFLALAFVGVVLASYEKMLVAGIIVAIATTFRPDAVLFAPIICCAYIFFNNLGLRRALTNKQLIKFACGFFLIAIPWLLFLYSYYGRISPGTMDAKKAQILIGGFPTYNLNSILGYVSGSIQWIAGVAILVGIAFFGIKLFNSKQQTSKAFIENQHSFIGICWLVFLVISIGFYISINVTFWRWYGIPAVFSLMIIAFCGFCAFASKNNETQENNAKSALFIALGTAVLLATNIAHIKLWLTSENVNPHTKAYYDISQYLKKAEPDGTVIEMAEPGSFGMQLGPKFTVVDELGLISPGVAKALLQGDKTYTNRIYNPKYIVCSWGNSYSACAIPEIIMNYDFVGEFNADFWTKFLGHGAKLYRKNTSNLLPLGQYVSNPVLGDKYGIVRQNTDRKTLFVHPGDTPTSFNLETSSLITGPGKALPVLIGISKGVPDSAVASGGATAGVTIYLDGKVFKERSIIKVGTSLAIDLPYSQGRPYRFSVDNNGVSNNNWVDLSASY
ncbi:hypothetical protein [Pseudomonas kribbensis]|uniref:hypothetical protein n=1 Tax=Pseudomonas kribbensis TaxID=1628086 RepID=UPI001F39F9C8|nr:hypothetical protein [Pseudomonas kribbensis]UIN54938.1 hypothetical protein LXN51_00915 [Pseudomonas kribbensis]